MILLIIGDVALRKSHSYTKKLGINTSWFHFAVSFCPLILVSFEAFKGYHICTNIHDVKLMYVSIKETKQPCTFCYIFYRLMHLIITCHKLNLFKL